jgi:hypothetical protein
MILKNSLRRLLLKHLNKKWIRNGRTQFEIGNIRLYVKFRDINLTAKFKSY